MHSKSEPLGTLWNLLEPSCYGHRLDALLPEFDHEMGTTRRLLDRVPEAALRWKPHEKSMSLGQLADHLANLTGWANLIATSTTFDIATVGDDRQTEDPASRDAMLARFDEKVAAARAELVVEDGCRAPGAVDAEERRRTRSSRCRASARSAASC